MAGERAHHRHDNQVSDPPGVLGNTSVEELLRIEVFMHTQYGYIYCQFELPNVVHCMLI